MGGYFEPSFPDRHTPQFSEYVSFIWSVADLLRGDYKQSEYGRFVLPLTVLCRLDSVLEPTRRQVLEAAQQHASGPEALRRHMLPGASGERLYNTSTLGFFGRNGVPDGFAELTADPEHLVQTVLTYINKFSQNARTTFEYFDFGKQVERLHRAGLLFLILKLEAEIQTLLGEVMVAKITPLRCCQRGSYAGVVLIEPTSHGPARLHEGSRPHRSRLPRRPSSRSSSIRRPFGRKGYLLHNKRWLTLAEAGDYVGGRWRGDTIRRCPVQLCYSEATGRDCA